MALLLVYLALAIGVSFLCSILEAVLLSMPPSYVFALKQSGSRAGGILSRLREELDRPLAAILSLNTVAHTVGAAGVGAQAQFVFQSVPFAVISGVLTLLILIVSEIIPKTLGATYWRALAVPSIYVIQALVVLMWPLVVMSQGLGKWLRPKQAEATVSRDELLAMTNLGLQEGVIDRADADLLRGVLKFQAKHVEDVYTPRPVVVSLWADSTIRQAMAQLDRLTYSRYPVLEDQDQILGYVLKIDLLTAAAKDEWDRDLRGLVREMPIVSQRMPLKGALTLFLGSREHMAAVVDEFGSFGGVLTLEDVVETLIGHEIIDEADKVKDLRQLAREAARQSARPARLPVRESV